jgi:adenylate cyclase class IV
MQKIGLSVSEEMEKHHLSYQINSVRFDIDHYTSEYGYIPVFLEIEGPKEEIKKYTELLGFQEKDCLPWSTDELIEYYKRKKGL